jgi:hypothetical protein
VRIRGGRRLELHFIRHETVYSQIYSSIENKETTTSMPFILSAPQVY